MSEPGMAPDDWEPSPHEVRKVLRAIARIRERGGALNYSEAHLAARWHLGFHDRPLVKCVKCPLTDGDTTLHAALNWEAVPPERLRVDYAGHVFSTAPDLDYLPMCPSCHRRHDSWRKALPAGIIRV